MQLANFLAENPKTSLLVRGSGLSYNDSCFNSDSYIIDSERLNHFIDFNLDTGIVLCQGGVLLKDLFLLHPDFIPPVLPGTVHATVAGAIAHDVHGKNNHQAGSFGHHLIGFELLIGGKTFYCSRNKNTELFHASIAGLGLTGIITRVELQLKKAPRFVQARHTPFDSLSALAQQMMTNGIQHNYQVAWLDLLNSKTSAIHSVADFCDPFTIEPFKIRTLPKIPFSLLKPWNLKLFNQHYFDNKPGEEKLGLEQFNNPLDKIIHWNRLYGPKGLIQFQAVFNTDLAASTLNQLLEIIRFHKAIPTLAVLKLFTQSGEGLLSFCKPGFTLAVDFIYNESANKAIHAMNQLIMELGGRVYLAKDWLLNEAQYRTMYEKHQQFLQVLEHHACSMNSDLAKRLGIR